MKKLTTLIALTAIAGSASAALVITDGIQQLITFESDIAGVFVANQGTEGNYNMLEPEAWEGSEWNDNRGAGLITTAASSSQEWFQSGAATLMLADSNGDGDIVDQIGFNQIGVNVGAGAAGNHAYQLAQDNDYAFNKLFLRIQNNTGAAVAQWQFGALVYFGESDASGFSSVGFSYAIDNGTDPDAMTFTSFGSSITAAQGNVITDLAGTMSETVTASVADGGYIVLAFNDPSGAGSDIWLDDIGVTAIPEPATLGMVAMCGVSALFIRRRLMI